MTENIEKMNTGLSTECRILLKECEVEYQYIYS